MTFRAAGDYLRIAACHSLFLSSGRAADAGPRLICAFCRATAFQRSFSAHGERVRRRFLQHLYFWASRRSAIEGRQHALRHLLSRMPAPGMRRRGGKRALAHYRSMIAMRALDGPAAAAAMRLAHVDAPYRPPKEEEASRDDAACHAGHYHAAADGGTTRRRAPARSK